MFNTEPTCYSTTELMLVESRERFSGRRPLISSQGLKDGPVVQGHTKLN